MVDLGVTFGFLKDKDGIVTISNRIFETQLYDTFLSEMAVNNRLYEKLKQREYRNWNMQEREY